MYNENFTVRDFCEHEDWFSVNREYQRESGVWSLKDEQHLIDTVLNDLDMPKIYLGKLSDRDYEIVDGQQRIKTLQKFRNNEFGLSGEISGYNYDEKRYNELSENDIRTFDDFQIHTVVLEDFDDEDIRAMFRKLQRGDSLNWREKLNAYPGSIVPFTRTLAGHSFRDKLSISLNRYRAYGLVARFLLLEDRGITDISPRYIREFYKQNENKDEDWSVAQKVRRVLNFLDQAFPEKTPELNKESWIINCYLLASYLVENYDMSEETDTFREFYVETWREIGEHRESGSGIEAVRRFIDANTSGTTSKSNIKIRYEYLVEEFLRENPDIPSIDSNRGFNHFERTTIWRLQDRKCADCDDRISFEELEAHHIQPHSRGGETTLENAEGLCEECHNEAHSGDPGTSDV